MSGWYHTYDLEPEFINSTVFYKGSPESWFLVFYFNPKSKYRYQSAKKCGYLYPFSFLNRSSNWREVYVKLYVLSNYTTEYASIIYHTEHSEFKVIYK